MVLIIGTHKRVPLILGNLHVSTYHAFLLEATHGFRPHTWGSTDISFSQFSEGHRELEVPIEMRYMVVSHNQGYHVRGPYKKDCNILGSVLGYPI